MSDSILPVLTQEVANPLINEIASDDTWADREMEVIHKENPVLARLIDRALEMQQDERRRLTLKSGMVSIYAFLRHQGEADHLSSS